MKTAVFAALALVVGSVVLDGCGSQSIGESSRRNASQGISVTDGRFVLPAVKGNPGAAYFTVHNDSAAPATITGATVKGAGSAMFHQTTRVNGMAGMDMLSQMAVPANGELVLRPGDKHLMAMDLDDSLKEGGTTDVSLTIAGGENVTFPIEILAAGDAR